MRPNLKWEYLTNFYSDEFVEVIRRARIHGGWLVQATTAVAHPEAAALSDPPAAQSPKVAFAESLTFVPDAEGKWKIENVRDIVRADAELKMKGLKNLLN